MSATNVRKRAGSGRIGAPLMRLPGVAALLPLAQSALPDPARTPGALNPEVTQATIGITIASEGGPRRLGLHRHTRTHLRQQQIRGFGYADRHLGAYEKDHLVFRWGSEARHDPRNLWPEPRASPPAETLT